MKKYNISVPREYEKDGVTKTAWGNVGKLVRFEATADKPEGFAIELYMFPTTKFMVFEEKPKEAPAQDAPTQEVVADEPPF